MSDQNKPGYLPGIALAMRRARLVTVSAAMLLTTLLAVATALEVAPPSEGLAAEGQALKQVCGHCHSLQIVMDTPMSYDAWHDTVQTMIDRGASGTNDQLADIMDYLHRTMTTVNVNTANADELEMVLHVPETVARSIIARRSTKEFIDLSDLKSIPGIEASTMDARARLIFFK